MTMPPTQRPSPVPHPLRAVLWALFLIALTSYFFQYYGVPLPRYLGLSVDNISHWHLWTYITYPFTYPHARLFDLLFHLGFNLFFFWVFGLPLLERIGSFRFLVLFFGATLFAGLAATLGLFLLHSPETFSGPTPALLALITTWTILQANQAVHVTHYAFRPFWIFAILVGLNLALDALSAHWIQLIADASAGLFAYFFCLISERAPSTIRLLYPFERLILKTIERFKHRKSAPTSKIIDFHTGEPYLTDEQFLDAMLTKINKSGKDSLTPHERTRLQRISEKKSKK